MKNRNSGCHRYIRTVEQIFRISRVEEIAEFPYGKQRSKPANVMHNYVSGIHEFDNVFNTI